MHNPLVGGTRSVEPALRFHPTMRRQQVGRNAERFRQSRPLGSSPDTIGGTRVAVPPYETASDSCKVR